MLIPEADPGGCRGVRRGLVASFSFKRGKQFARSPPCDQTGAKRRGCSTRVGWHRKGEYGGAWAEPCRTWTWNHDTSWWPRYQGRLIDRVATQAAQGIRPPPAFLLHRERICDLRPCRSAWLQDWGWAGLAGLAELASAAKAGCLQPLPCLPSRVWSELLAWLWSANPMWLQLTCLFPA